MSVFIIPSSTPDLSALDELPDTLTLSINEIDTVLMTWIERERYTAMLRALVAEAERRGYKVEHWKDEATRTRNVKFTRC